MWLTTSTSTLCSRTSERVSMVCSLTCSMTFRSDPTSSTGPGCLSILGDEDLHWSTSPSFRTSCSNELGVNKLSSGSRFGTSDGTGSGSREGNSKSVETKTSKSSRRKISVSSMSLPHSLSGLSLSTAVLRMGGDELYSKQF